MYHKPTSDELSIFDYCDIMYHKPTSDELSIFDYCDIMYHKPTNDELSIFDYEYNICPNKRFNDMIESVQYNAGLAVTGCKRGTLRHSHKIPAIVWKLLIIAIYVV